MTILANFKERENALKRHIRDLAPNLVKEYICELLTGADDKTIDLFVITMRAQNAVPAKVFTDTVPVMQFEMVDEDEEFPDDGEPNI